MSLDYQHSIPSFPHSSWLNYNPSSRGSGRLSDQPLCGLVSKNRMVAVFTPLDPSGSDAQNNWVRIETTTKTGFVWWKDEVSCYTIVYSHFVAMGLDAIDSHLLLGLQHCHIEGKIRRKSLGLSRKNGILPKIFPDIEYQSTKRIDVLQSMGLVLLWLTKAFRADLKILGIFENSFKSAFPTSVPLPHVVSLKSFEILWNGSIFSIFPGDVTGPVQSCPSVSLNRQARTPWRWLPRSCRCRIAGICDGSTDSPDSCCLKLPPQNSWDWPFSK